MTDAPAAPLSLLSRDAPLTRAFSPARVLVIASALAIPLAQVLPAVAYQGQYPGDLFARLSHVPNMAAVAGWDPAVINSAGTPTIEVDGYATAGDGGRHRMVFDSANLCGAGGHPAADGVACVNSTVVTTGSWNIDEARISTAMYGTKCNGLQDETTKIQAAVTTGRNIYVPRGAGKCRLTNAITMVTPSQILEGDGLPQLASPFPGTRFDIGTDFNTSALGVIVSQMPGNIGSPVIRNLGVVFSQVDTSDITKIVQYPSAYYMQNAAGLLMDNVGCIQAWTCLDKRGNSGGSRVVNAQFFAYKYGVREDGALDTTTYDDPHFFPYGASGNQVALLSNTTWFDVGRADDLQVNGGLAIGGTDFVFHGGSDGTGSCSQTNIQGFAFDSYQTAAITMSCGQVDVASGYMGTQSSGSYDVSMTGGHLTISHPKFIAFGGGTYRSNTPHFLLNGAGPNNGTAFVDPNGTTETCQPYAYCGFPRMNINNAPVTMNNDSPFLIIYNGAATLNGNLLTQSLTNGNGSGGNPVTYTALQQSKIILYPSSGQSARLVMTGNQATDINVTGTLVNISTDDYNYVVGNPSPGWTKTLPASSAKGTYAPN